MKLVRESVSTFLVVLLLFPISVLTMRREQQSSQNSANGSTNMRRQSSDPKAGNYYRVLQYANNDPCKDVIPGTAAYPVASNNCKEALRLFQTFKKTYREPCSRATSADCERLGGDIHYTCTVRVKSWLPKQCSSPSAVPFSTCTNRLKAIHAVQEAIAEREERIANDILEIQRQHAARFPTVSRT